MERRYAGILNSLFLVCTYSFSMPILPLITSVVFIFQYVVDKLQITYYWKERVEHNDYLNRSAIRVMQYGIVLFYLFSFYGMAANFCTLHNDQNVHLLVATEFFPCFGYTDTSYVMLGFAGFYFVFLIVLSYCDDRRNKTKFHDLVNIKESNYFCRISEHDRKRWIAIEYYRRENYGISLLTDAVLEKMKNQIGRDLVKSNDPPSYDILVNSEYGGKF